MAGKFAEMLAAKNQAYDSLIRQAKEAAAGAHADRVQMKSEADKQKQHLHELLVRCFPAFLKLLLISAPAAQNAGLT